MTAKAVDRPLCTSQAIIGTRQGLDGTHKETAVRPVKSPALLHSSILSLPHYPDMRERGCASPVRLLEVGFPSLPSARRGADTDRVSRPAGPKTSHGAGEHTSALAWVRPTADSCSMHVPNQGARVEVGGPRSVWRIANAWYRRPSLL